MKKLIFVFALFFISCEDSVSPLPDSSLYLDSIPSSASVYVDGKYRGRTPKLMKLLAGEYRITLAKELWKDTTFYFNIGNGMSLTKEIELMWK
jgi:hypothetical protein